LYIINNQSRVKPALLLYPLPSYYFVSYSFFDWNDDGDEEVVVVWLCDIFEVRYKIELVL